MDPEKEPMPSRWTSNFRDASDGLVHYARASWRATQVITPTGVYPSMAHTSCGLIVTATKAFVNTGTYLGEEAAITCVRCLGGAKDGENRRYVLKELAFATMYGSTPEQLRTRLGHLRNAEAGKMVSTYYGRYGKSLFQRCQRLRMTLFAKAAACTSE